jgi:HNH endonuclease
MKKTSLLAQPEFRRHSKDNTLAILEALKSGAISCNPETAQVFGLNKNELKDRVNFFGYHQHQFRINGKKVTAYTHKIVWLCVHGSIATDHEIDHIINDKDNNTISNLQQLHWRKNLQKRAETKQPLQTAF